MSRGKWLPFILKCILNKITLFPWFLWEEWENLVSKMKNMRIFFNPSPPKALKLKAMLLVNWKVIWPLGMKTHCVYHLVLWIKFCLVYLFFCPQSTLSSPQRSWVMTIFLRFKKFELIRIAEKPTRASDSHTASFPSILHPNQTSPQQACLLTMSLETL